LFPGNTVRLYKTIEEINKEMSHNDDNHVEHCTPVSTNYWYYLVSTKIIGRVCIEMSHNHDNHVVHWCAQTICTIVVLSCVHKLLVLGLLSCFHKLLVLMI